MRKLLIAAVVAAGLGGAAYYSGMFAGSESAPAAQGGAAAQGGGGFGGQGFPAGGNFGGGRGGRSGGTGPLTVEVATTRRARIAQELTVVGNLIGETTVSVAPRAAGRLQEVYVRLGDRVGRGQRIAKIEDFELVEQIKQQEAARRSRRRRSGSARPIWRSPRPTSIERRAWSSGKSVRSRSSTTTRPGISRRRRSSISRAPRRCSRRRVSMN